MSGSKYAGWGAREIADVERRVRTYLADKARNGPVYVTTARVADDLDLSPQRAGQAVAKLEEKCGTLEIDQWSGRTSGSGYTWHVENTGPTPFGEDCSDCGWLLPDGADECPTCGQGVDR